MRTEHYTTPPGLRLTYTFEEGKKLAEAATQGEWTLNGEGDVVSRTGPLERVWVANCPHSEDDAAHTAHFNPANVLRLLAELDAKDVEIADLHWKLDNNVRSCQCSADEACAHVQRAEAAEAEIARLREDLQALNDWLKRENIMPFLITLNLGEEE